MNDRQPSASPPEEPHSPREEKQETADFVVLAWAAVDLLIALSLAFFVVALFPAFQEGPDHAYRYAADESPIPFAMMLFIPLFATVNGMRRGFLDQWIGKRYAGQLDQIAFGAVGFVLVLTVGYIEYESVNARLIYPAVVIAVMLPTCLLIGVIRSAALKEEQNAAQYWDYHGRPGEALAAQMSRTAAKVWLCAALAAAALAVSLGVAAQSAARDRPPRIGQPAAPAPQEGAAPTQTP
ncbi:hypothetical protein [uncultured Stenotrophomonas sp.]|uniref:hypothetical protein n=1 Tax=uncultured Stenotrophomonas sp. TaxID=165438 RepID=UPI0025FF67CC|nr:hypothetical protein [uncultured Stenotrophomonas sp.]